MNSELSFRDKQLGEPEKYINSIGLILIIFLIIFSFFNSLNIGLAWDEYFHHLNGLLRFEYLSKRFSSQQFLYKILNIFFNIFFFFFRSF